MIINVSSKSITNLPGIYMIIDLNNHKKWIGQAQNLYDRAAGHQGKFKVKANSKYLQEAYDEGHQFVFVVLDVLPDSSKKERIEYEKYYTSMYKTYEREAGYNINNGDDIVDEKRKEAARERLKEARKKLQYRKGELVKTAVVNDDIVKEITELIRNGLTDGEIAKIYKINSGIVYKIRNGITWKHITGGPIYTD